MKIKKELKDFVVLVLVTWCIALMTFRSNAQVVTQDSLVAQEGCCKENVFKKVYEDFLKYGTFYIAGDISNPYQKQSIDYVVRTNPSGSLYDVPVVQDATEYHEFDYRYGFGIRRIARFDYENKEKAYYDGTEKNVALSSPTAAFNGFEYLFHWEKERERGEVFINHRFFLRPVSYTHLTLPTKRIV